jgi:hypothetical protein
MKSSKKTTAMSSAEPIRSLELRQRAGYSPPLLKRESFGAALQINFRLAEDDARTSVQFD